MDNGTTLAAIEPMAGVACSGDRLTHKALAGSFLLHGLLALLLLFLPAISLPHAPLEETVAVEIVSPRELERGEQTDAMPEAPKSAAKPEIVSQPPRFEPLTKEPLQSDKRRLIEARQFLSSKILSDPQSAKARKAMGTLAPSERIIQLCNIEAMAQIRAGDASLRPDFVVAYALSDIELADHALEAEGGAFRSRGLWYGVHFRCAVSADYQTVASFAFRVGEPIAKAEWASHHLTSDDGPAD